MGGARSCVQWLLSTSRSREKKTPLPRELDVDKKWCQKRLLSMRSARDARDCDDCRPLDAQCESQEKNAAGHCKHCSVLCTPSGL